MGTFRNAILLIGALFVIFLILIGSVAGIAQMAFMVLIYLFRKPLRYLLRLITQRNFVLVVIVGTLFGLIEEVLWFVLDPGIQKTMYSSLSVDLTSKLPVYIIFYLSVYFLARKGTTQKKAFMYGGIFGYIFYFIAESGILGFQFGGVPGTPLWLLLTWEVNNFFLNGLGVWFPLYLSDLLTDSN